MIKLLHLPIKAPNGVFRVTNTTSLSQPSFELSVRLVLVPWTFLSGRVACVPFFRVDGWEDEVGRAGRGEAILLTLERCFDVDACGPFTLGDGFDGPAVAMFFKNRLLLDILCCCHCGLNFTKGEIAFPRYNSPSIIICAPRLINLTCIHTIFTSLTPQTTNSTSSDSCSLLVYPV